MGDVLIGEFIIGVWDSPMHLLNKCETGNKKQKREQYGSKIP